MGVQWGMRIFFFNSAASYPSSFRPVLLPLLAVIVRPVVSSISWIAVPAIREGLSRMREVVQPVRRSAGGIVCGVAVRGLVRAGMRRLTRQDIAAAAGEVVVCCRPREAVAVRVASGGVERRRKHLVRKGGALR